MNCTIKSAVWANAAKTAIRAEIETAEGSMREFTVIENDPSEEARAVWAACVAGKFPDDAASGGIIGDYVPRDETPIDISSIPLSRLGLTPPVIPPEVIGSGETPVVLLPAAMIRKVCDTLIAAGFSNNGVSRRASMNLWAAVVALAPADSRSADDRACATMTGLMNAWEGAMFAERDRLLAGDLTLADAHWPALPDGAAAFIALCDQG